MTMREIEDFLPSGTQLKSPGGLTFDLIEIVYVEAANVNDSRPVALGFKNGREIVLQFHRNTDGGPADTYTIKNNILQAVAALKE